MYLHNTVVLNRRQLALQGTYSNIWKCCYMCICAYTHVHVVMHTHITDTQWVEAKDAAKHPMMHRTAHPIPTKNYLVQSSNSVKVEKTWLNFAAVLSSLSLGTFENIFDSLIEPFPLCPENSYIYTLLYINCVEN